MIPNITSANVPQAYEELLWLFQYSRLTPTNSERGIVKTINDPVFLTILNPTQRVLFDPIRDANPFFHVMEFIWMMAGRNDATWISQFNSRFSEYADAHTTRINGAYGYRWRNHFGRDQIIEVASMLRTSPITRRAVLGMWDPDFDLDSHNDIPCNTHIYFRLVNGNLRMTVCNRSNDLIWGMLGANAVHMTMLHELICRATGLPIGRYQVFTNNLHIYEQHFPLIGGPPTKQHDWYYLDGLTTMPLLQKGEILEDFLDDCEEFTHTEFPTLHCEWMHHVALPMKQIYLERNNNRLQRCESIAAEDWQLACKQWVARRELKKVAEGN
jgi:hypothetical protein